MPDETAITEEIFLGDEPVEHETISSRTVVEIAALSDRGKIRPNNEDSYLVARFGRSLRTIMTNLPSADTPSEHAEIGYAMTVADGMGGAVAGEVASQTAITALMEFGIQAPDWIMRLNEKRARRVLERMEDRFSRLRTVLGERIKQEPTLSGMGTTMTVALSVGAELLIAHVGDSRAYLFTCGRLVPLTRDQTVAQLLADLGLIEGDEISKHHARHVLTGAITAEGDEAPVELHHLRLADGDQLLLCTDGLTEMVSDDDIAAVLKQEESARNACESLIDRALAAGGTDNVTVILARYQIPADAH